MPSSHNTRKLPVKIVRGIEYGRADGIRLKMDLYFTSEPSETPRPTVLLIHGGAWIIGTRHQLWWYARRLARAGYVAACISYRMMPLFPFPYCVHDCKAAVRWLRLNADRYNVDSNRIAALGNSAGGHLAGLLAVTRPRDGFEGLLNPTASSAVQAAVSLYGAVDLTEYREWRSRGPLRRIGARFVRRFVAMGNGRRQGSDAYEAASPITYAHAGAPPMLFIHGTKDFLVDLEQSNRFYARLVELGMPAELVAVQGRGHAFDFFHPRKRREVWRLIRAFLDAHLPPSEQDAVALPGAVVNQTRTENDW